MALVAKNLKLPPDLDQAIRDMSPSGKITATIVTLLREAIAARQGDASKDLFTIVGELLTDGILDDHPDKADIEARHELARLEIAARQERRSPPSADRRRRPGSADADRHTLQQTSSYQCGIADPHEAHFVSDSGEVRHCTGIETPSPGSQSRHAGR